MDSGDKRGELSTKMICSRYITIWEKCCYSIEIVVDKYHFLETPKCPSGSLGSWTSLQVQEMHSSAAAGVTAEA